MQPDLTLWFDVAPERAAERRARARAADRFEAEDLAFFERVRAGYLARMAQAPDRFVRIDSAQDPADVRRQIDRALAERGILASTQPMSDARSERGAGRTERALPLPWLAAPLRQALATRHGHALLIHGPGAVGQFELALVLAQAWLCEQTSLPLVERPCRACAACRLVAARSHPDLLVLVPEALRESLGWAGDAGEGDDERESSKKKPSKDIRIEAIRAAIAFATTTSARGRGKVVVVHPAERMNPAAANAFLKTLEEPAGDSRFLLCSAAPDALAATIRSRCQDVALAVPPRAEAEAWLAGARRRCARRAPRRQWRPPPGGARLGRKRRRRERVARASRADRPRRRLGAARLVARSGRRRPAEALPRRRPRWPAAASRATSRAPA